MICQLCHGAGCAYCGWGYVGAGSAPAKPAPKVGELYVGSCKRCRGDSSLRVSKVLLDKLELFCKLCGKEQEVKL